MPRASPQGARLPVSLRWMVPVVAAGATRGQRPWEEISKFRV